METLTNLLESSYLIILIIFVLWAVINFFIDMTPGLNESNIAYQHPHYADQPDSPNWFKNLHVGIIFIWGSATMIWLFSIVINAILRGLY